MAADIRKAREAYLLLRAPREELRLEAARALIEHQDILPGQAKVVVAMLGRERSPETLVEIGGSLANGSVVDVMHVTDVPEQVMLDSALEEDPAVTSLRRRINALGEELKISVNFDPVVTRDVIRTIHDTTVQVHCGWLVMEWREDPNLSILRPTAIGWLADHLSCNFGVFKDSGARTFKEILVMPKPGPHDALVVQTAENIAEEYAANVTLAQFVRTDEEGEGSVESAERYLAEVAKVCRDGSSTKTRIITGDKEVPAVARVTAEYDLLILAAPPERGLLKQIGVPTVERITQFSGCSVLQVKTPRKGIHSAADFPMEDASDLKLADYMVEECGQAKVPWLKKETLFSEISAAFAKGIPETTKKDLEVALWAREEVQNTGVGKGVALPHATVAGLTKSYLGVFTTSEAIDYGAAEPVDVFFVMVGPPEERQSHLVVLSKLARLVSSDTFLARIREASANEELLPLMEEFEKEANPRYGLYVREPKNS